MLLPWWQVELAAVGMCQCIKADVKTLLADVIAMGLYFIFSSVVLTRTSCHTLGRWYLPMFLFRDGLLTLMYIDSFINLERLCSSLPTILKLLILLKRFLTKEKIDRQMTGQSSTPFMKLSDKKRKSVTFETKEALEKTSENMERMMALMDNMYIKLEQRDVPYKPQIYQRGRG